MAFWNRKACATAALCFCLAGTLALFGCGGQDSADGANQESGTDAQEERDSFIVHGADYGKTEQVNVATGLDGQVSDIAVKEVISNPDEKKEIRDVSTLNAISFSEEDLPGVKLKQDGSALTWTTAKQDITYTGTTSEELPFTISYDYQLDGKSVDPASLKNVSGKLKLTVTYEVSETMDIKVGSSTRTVKTPYLFATLVTLDPEHARDVEVDTGAVVSMSGNQIAAGVALPNLKETLQITDSDLEDLDLGDSDDSFDIPEKVVITATVKGFDMPDVTTMCTASLFSKLGERVGDAADSTDSLFDTLGDLVTALKNISKGTGKIATGVGGLASGEEKLGSNLPNAVSGLKKLSKLATGIGTQAKTAAGAASDASDSVSGAIEDVDKLLEDEALSDEQRETLQGIRKSLSEAKQKAAQASAVLTDKEKGAATLASRLSSGITSASEGISQVATGVNKFATVLDNLQTALSKLAKGTKKMGKNMAKMIEKVQDLIEEKSDTIAALGEAVDNAGAWCGSAEGMPATTMFTVTAKA